MPRRTLDSRFGLLLVSSLVACVAEVGGCSSNDGGIEPSEQGGSNAGGHSGGGSAKGGSSATSGGTGATSGTAGMNQGEGGAPEGGGGSVEGGTASAQGGTKSGSGGVSTGGTPTGDAGAGLAGASAEGGAVGTGGVGGGTVGEAGAGGDMGERSCVYFTEGGEAVDPDGAGGAPTASTITVMKNAFAGLYLADGAGKALYTYGADAPGDCSYPPVTTCFAADKCSTAWPPFNGEPRVLGAGLDDSLFGSIQRTDDTVVSSQTTYRGWPLYYYKNDTAPTDPKVPGDVKGQAVGKIWQLATVTLPNIVILRVGTLRFVADEAGHALYTSAADTKGTQNTRPISACTGDCLDAFEPFALSYLSPVSYLLASDFSYFVRGDGAPQIAYKGAPLYLSHADVRSGETNGTATEGWSVAAP